MKTRKMTRNRSIKTSKNAGTRSSDRFLDSKHEKIDPRDTISRLPDTLLHHIISFLSSSDKDNTHALSKNWRRVNAHTQKTLTLIGRKLDEPEFSRILDEVCPLVERLSLERCFESTTLTLVKLKLKAVELNYCGSLKTVQLNTPNLETFVFRGAYRRPCTIEFSLCKQLKTVHLSRVAINNMLFFDCKKSFPVLQDLILSCCDLSEGMNIISDSLEQLTLLQMNVSMNMRIEAPNLQFFVFNGNMIPVLSMKCPNLISATVELYSSPYQKLDKLWFLNLSYMLFGLRRTQRLILHSNDPKNIVFPKEHRGRFLSPFCEMLRIEVRTSFKSSTIVDLVDSMLWICPRVRKIVLSSYNRMLDLTLFHGVPPTGACGYCRSDISRCWRHTVTSYSLIQDFDEFQLELSFYLFFNLRKVGRYAASSTNYVERV